MRTESQSSFARSRMIRPISLRHVLRAVAFLAALVIAPSTTRATCGDYVLLGKSGLEKEKHRGIVGGLGLPSTDPTATPRSEHQPCKGPHCSRGFPSTPVPTPSL